MNTRELKAEMARFGDTNHTLALALGTSDATCSNKANGKSEFTQSQICAIKERYNLSSERVIAIFFDEKVS